MLKDKSNKVAVIGGGHTGIQSFLLSKTPQTPFYLLSEANVTPSHDKDDNTPRQFSGVANSGQSFVHWGDKCIVDMEGITHQETMPILFLHDREQGVGFGKLSVVDNQLIANGTLLSNEKGKEIAQMADEGFPWQMSAHIVPSSIEYVKEGEVTVNGQTLSAPISVLRQCKVAEVSFTPTGVDDQTHATVLSDDGNPNHSTQSNQTDKDNTMNLEEALAEIEKLKAEVTTKQERIDELEETAKEANVDAELSQAGFSKSDDGKWQGVSNSTVNLLLSASDEDRKATITDLAQSLQLSKGNDDMPDFLTHEGNVPNNQGNCGKQLSNNPLVANAMARGKDGDRF